MHDIIDRLRTKKDDEGFTLIELLVVVVIIGVLVAIAVPVYLNYRQGAADKSAQSDVRGAISAVEQFYTNNGNTYPDATTADGTVSKLTLSLAAGGSASTVTLSDKTKLGYWKETPGGTYYKICATSGNGSGKWYVYNSQEGGSVKTSTALTLTTCA
ncbi:MULTISPECIES: prepilin-type N-terminal cleavage/methylation domain-containing protein [Actinoplanes]|uniref:prepilin-type N-terminal cleavage/methylation domain-containing protein n=1 Tax=Actinoplanes TaxID=1865 RepID=UPI0005F29E87|nr:MULTISPECIES: prepilin-type N-terminal cleavage/methylation domain-containing protein [Actinoplanes]GLY01213.1 pili assembly chaperone [Actinoplanes sp. NBRC 101535]